MQEGGRITTPPLSAAAALLLLLLYLAATAANPRVVVTFRNASLNAEAVVPENATVVKQYGRRLVLSIGETERGGSNQEWIQEALGGEDRVERVEEDVLASAFDYHSSNDTNFTETGADSTLMLLPTASISLPASLTGGWNLDESEPYGLHIRSLRRLTNGYNATLAIIDSGIAEAAVPLFHPAAGFDFVSSPDYSNKPNQARNPDYTDPGDQGPTCPTPSWHGTKVASVATAIAPGATLAIMRVLGRCGVGFSSDIADAIVWAAGGQINGLGANPFPASTISLSLAGKSPCPSYLQSAVSQARSLGATVLAAAGNAAQNVSLYFPANCYGVLAVGASTRQGTLAAYSNWGDRLAFSAQGGDAANPIPVMSVTLNGLLAPAFATGTSFAAPHAAGFIALLQSIGLLMDSVGLVTLALCIEKEKCIGKGILSSKTPSPGLDAMIPPANITPTEKSNGNSSMAVASGNCAAGQGRVCESSCFLNVGSCRNAWCEECQSCPSGYYCPGDNNKYTCQVCIGIQYRFGCGGSSEGWCKNDGCSSGLYLSTTNFMCNSCDRCGAGEYVINCGGTNKGDCTACAQNCPDLQYRASCRSTDPGYCAWCSECGAGTRFAGCTGGDLYDSRSCPGCEAGKYSLGGRARDCTVCGAGKYNPNTNSPSEMSCILCPAGKYNPNTGSASLSACINCPPGTYQQSSGSPTPQHCWKCSTGSYSTANGRSSLCLSCSKGTYASAEGQTACTQCTAGTYSNTDGAFNTGFCNQCLAGKSSTSLGATAESSCTACQAGKFNSRAGALACENCAAGTFTLSTGLNVCTACGAGKYSTAAGLSGACSNCDAGKFNAGTGAASSAACQPCSGGTSGPNAGASICSPCAAGKYAGTTGKTACDTCLPGTFTTVQGTVSCNPCVALTNCAVASESACIPDFGSKCVACAAIYACVYQSNACFVSGSTTVPACLCSPGFELLNGRCSGCVAGKFKAVNGTGPCATITSPLVCPPGKYLQLGTAFANSACLDCPPLPPNTRDGASGCEWSCSAGFDNNAP